jgi:uncharacterized OsmC-like protein
MESIRQAVETASDRLAAHPEAAVEPAATAVALRDEGLRCRVRGAGGEVFTDMGKAVGGGATAPTPGWMLRAAIASCDVTAIAIEAACAGVELTQLTVTVDSESDARGVLGIGDAPAGPLAITVRIELAAGNATADQLRELAERARSRSALHDALARRMPVTTEVVT